MAKGQPITKEEMSVILNEAFVGFRKEMRNDIVEIVSDFHEKVEVPMMDQVLLRLGNVEREVGGVKKRMGELEANLGNKVDKLERKLDKITDHQAEKLDDHENRIIRLEAIV